MTLLIAATVWRDYRNQLELHGLPERETVAAYAQMIADAATAHLARKSAEHWQADRWAYHAAPSSDYHYDAQWIDPKLPADVAIPFVRSAAALGYDPSTLLSDHFEQAARRLRSLAPQEPDAFDIPILDIHGNPAPDVDLRRTDPCDAFDVPPRRYNDPSP